MIKPEDLTNRMVAPAFEAIRVLVAKADGVPARDGKAFAVGCAFGGHAIPVVREWDFSQTCGSANLVAEGSDLYADITLSGGLSCHDVASLFPALGGKALGFTEHEKQVATYGDLVDTLIIFTQFDVVCVSLNVAQNSDERIPPVGGWTT